MRIVLTGGWGYGNLGDDAILDSTIENIKIAYPDCTIDVLTYDLDDSMICTGRSSVRMHKSVHAYIDLNSSELSFKKLEKDYSFFHKAFLMSKRKIVDSPLWCNASNFGRQGKLAIEIIRNADLLVVAGGGYFNERWMSSVMAHLVQMKAAIEFRVPFCVAGPTIGTFSSPTVRKFVMDIFRGAASIYVRDTFSLKQFEKENITAKIIPDIVLSKWKDGLPNLSLGEEVVVGLVITSRNKELQKKVTSSVAKFLSNYSNGSIKILMSRRWKQDLAASLAAQKDLENYGLDAEIIIPGSFHSLENSLSRCDIIISENLHGLILATRNGVPIVAINDYSKGSPNYKKFTSFTEQANSQNFVISGSISDKDVVDMIFKSYLSKDLFSENSKNLCNNVKMESEIFFSDLKQFL